MTFETITYYDTKPRRAFCDAAARAHRRGGKPARRRFRAPTWLAQNPASTLFAWGAHSKGNQCPLRLQPLYSIAEAGGASQRLNIFLSSAIVSSGHVTAWPIVLGSS